MDGRIQQLFYGSQQLLLDSVHHPKYPTAMNLGARLKYARKKRGMTQEQLSEKSGADQAVISALEKRNSKRTQYVGTLAAALDVDPTWLQDGGPEPDWTKPSRATASEEQLTPDVIALAKAIARMPEQNRKLLMRIFEHAIPDDDPRLNQWNANGKTK